MKDRLETVRTALSVAGLDEPARPRLLTSTYEITQGTPAQRRFWQEADELDLTEVYSESYPCDAAEIATDDDAIFRETGTAAVYKLEGTIVLASLADGYLRLRVAGSSQEQIEDAASEFRSRFPFAAPGTDSLVPMTFWSFGPFGPQRFTRRIDVSPWDGIQDNYSSDVRSELAGLMDGFEPGKDGQLLLWQGPPGTGKTWALRALASEWRDWAEFHYITDPDAFFGDHAYYMVDVLLHEPYEQEAEEKWRVLILEDTGEMLGASAKAKTGQALSRLLNVVDGLIGQGLRVLVLITTNDELGELHPAVSRPGRCAAQLEFGPLSAEEASTWLGAEVEEGGTLAELYARKPSEGAEGSLLAAAGDPAVPVLDQRPDTQPDAQVETPPQRTNAAQTQWEATLLVEDALTEDGRYIAPGATSWRELPLSLMAMIETSEGGHVGAVLAGRIDEIWRDGNRVMGAGIFDDGEYGQEIARLVSDRTLRGNSVDLAILEYETAPRSDFDESGHRIAESEQVDPFDAMLEGDAPPVFVINDCVIGMSTVCPFPAFADAEIAVVASAAPMVWQYRRQTDMVVIRKELVAAGPEEPGETIEEEGERLMRVVDEALKGLTASAAGLAPLKPPVDWFSDPGFSEPTAITITEEGRIFGHAALWGTCHIGIPDVCVEPPPSPSNYAYFLLGELETEEGQLVSVGKVTLGTGHASKRLGRKATVEHYDNTGAGAADVVAGDDGFGIWVSGALRPDLSAERVRELRAASLSGDWRDTNGHLELCALLAVNVPGFPVPRTRALVAAGADGEAHVLALVAAGVNDGRPRIELTETERNQLAALRAAADGGLEALAELAAA